MLELVWAGPKISGFYALVEDCPPSETVGVAKHARGIDGLEDAGAIVLLGHLSPPLKIVLELLGESGGARLGCRRGDHVVKFSKVEPRH